MTTLSESRNENLVKNSFILSFGTLIPKALTILVLPILTSYLTTAEYGNYDLVLSATSLIVPVATMQIQQAIFRFLLGNREKFVQEGYIASSLAFILFMSLVSCPVTYIVGLALNLPKSISIIMCLLVAAESLYMLLGQVMRGIGKTLNYSLGVIIYAVVNVILLVIFLPLMKLGLNGVVISITVAYATSAFSMYFITIRSYKVSLKKFNKGQLKELLSFSAPIVPSSISLWVVNLSDRIIIVYFLGAAANGIYSVANKIPALYSTAYNVFNLAWTETAARVADDDSDPAIYYTQMFKKMFYFLVGVMLVIIAISPAFYSIFVNAQYYDSYYQTAVLYFGVFFNSLVMYYASIYIALKKTRQVGYSSAAGAVINAVVNLLMVNTYGLYAASVSTMVSYLVITIYRAIDINRYIRIRYDVRQISFGLLCMILSSMLYFQRTIPCIVLCYLIALAYNLVFNRYLVMWFWNKACRLILRRSH